MPNVGSRVVKIQDLSEITNVSYDNSSGLNTKKKSYMHMWNLFIFFGKINRNTI